MLLCSQVEHRYIGLPERAFSHKAYTSAQTHPNTVIKHSEEKKTAFWGKGPTAFQDSQRGDLGAKESPNISLPFMRSK